MQRIYKNGGKKKQTDVVFALTKLTPSRKTDNSI